MPDNRPCEALQSGRRIIRDLAARHCTANPRVYGPVLTGQDRAGGELNLLVDAQSETTLFELSGLQEALEEALGVKVDVRTPLELPARIRAEILQQAVPV
jgi:predicted nucleotidyltransferase